MTKAGNYLVNAAEIREQPNRNTFPCYILCLACAALYSVTANALVGMVATFIICLYAFFVPEEEYFIFIFGLQFFREALPLKIGTSAFGFILFVYFVLAIKHLLERKNIRVETLLIVLLLILDILSSARIGVYKIGDNINWIGSMIYMVYILKTKAEKIDYQKLLIYFCLAVWTICIINVIAEHRIFGKTLLPSMYGVWTSEFEGFAFGEAYAPVAGGNALSLLIPLAITLCILNFPYVKKTSIKVFYAVSILFFGYCGTLTIARAFYVEIALFALLFVLSSKKKIRQSIKILLIFVITIFILSYFIEYLQDALIKVFFRFEKGNENREFLIEEAKRLFMSSSVFLIGAGSYYPDVYGFTAHNLYWDTAVSLGLFGCFVFWGIIITSILNPLKWYAKFNLKSLTPLLMLFAHRNISGSTRDVWFYYVIVLTVIYAIAQSKRGRTDNVQ